MMFFDALIINASMIIAIWLMADMDGMPISQWRRYVNLWPFMTVMCLISFSVFRMYRTLWSYASLDEVMQVVLGTLMGMGLTFAFSQIIFILTPSTGSWPFIPYPDDNMFLLKRGTYPVAWFLLTFFIMLERYSSRLLRRLRSGNRIAAHEHPSRVMIVGAGWAASSIIRDLATAGGRDGTAVVAVDDDPAKTGTRIGRIPVVRGIENIPGYVKEYEVDKIIIAIPSASQARLRELVEVCMPTGCKLMLVPGLRDVTNGNIEAGKLRDINIADLLFRDEVNLNVKSICGYIEGKCVLVTGGGGTIGSELCRQIVQFSPRRLVIFDIYENNAYELYRELEVKCGNSIEISLLIGSVRDLNRMRQVFDSERPDVVFHAAAHKHVPTMELSPAEAVKNNIFGTLNVAKCADEFGANRMLLISTDKAVNPTNVMGATKRVTEFVMQYMCRRSKTSYMAVRFGNVLASNGSVIPIFQKQIAAGGPVTVTHPDITRYFMTIPEAAQLVLQAGAIGESGNVFVLDMGTPVKIVDLARNLIRLSGYRPDDEIELKITGLRPGEKLYEELMMSEEKDGLCTTDHEKIFVLKPIVLDSAAFEQGLNALRITAHEHPEDVRTALKAIVPTYRMEEQKTAQVG